MSLDYRYTNIFSSFSLPFFKFTLQAIYNLTNFTCSGVNQTSNLLIPYTNLKKFTPYLDINQVGLQVIVILLTSILYCKL